MHNYMHEIKVSGNLSIATIIMSPTIKPRSVFLEHDKHYGIINIMHSVSPPDACRLILLLQ